MKLSFEIGNSAPAKQPVTGSMIRSNRVMPQHAQALRTLNRRMMRMYDAAISTNLNADFPVSISSGNSEILTSVSNVRSRARTLERDDPYAQAIIESMMVNVGGEDPFRLEMKVGKFDATGKFIEERETNRLIEDGWEEAGYPENCTVSRNMSRMEMDLQGIAAMVRDGGIIYRHYPGFPNNDFRYAIEPIEVDRLDQTYNRPKAGVNNEIQFSIEMDEYHGAVRYWILTRHPGDVFTSWSGQPRYREGVDAELISPLFAIRTRAGQYVGISKMASIITRLHQNRQFDVAHLTAAIWSACKPMFITKEFPTAMGEMVPDWVRKAIGGMMEAEGEGDGEKATTVEPGATTELEYGQKPFQLDPKFPIEAATGFKKDQLRASAAGSGAPYFQIAQDLESVNFSSARIGLEAFHDNCKILQKHFVFTVRRPHFNNWLKYALLTGKIDRPFARYEEFKRAAKWLGRRWDYIQPVQDAQADIMLIEAGLASRDEKIRERGGRGVEEVNAQIASDKESDELHGLHFAAAEQPEMPTDEPGEDGEKPEPKAKKSARNGRARSRLVIDL